MPLSTMYKMMSINPLDINPQQLVVAVQVPEGIKIRDGDVVIDFNFQTVQSNVSFKHKFLFKVNPDYPTPPRLNGKINGYITILQLTKEDTLTMFQAQKAVKKYRINNTDGAGSFNLNIVSACLEENFSLQNSELNIYLKLKKTEEFFTFIEGMNVTELDDNIQGFFKSIPYCTQG